MRSRRRSDKARQSKFITHLDAGGRAVNIGTRGARYNFAHAYTAYATQSTRASMHTTAWTNTCADGAYHEIKINFKVGVTLL